MAQPATTHDTKQILELINSENKYLLPRTEEEIRENIGNFAVIKEEGKIVACAAFENYAPKIAEIRSVVVHPSCRGKNYGEMLVKELLKRAKPKQEVFVVTSKVEYFKSLGFDYTLNNEKQILFFQQQSRE